MNHKALNGSDITAEFAIATQITSTRSALMLDGTSLLTWRRVEESIAEPSRSRGSGEGQLHQNRLQGGLYRFKYISWMLSLVCQQRWRNGPCVFAT